MKTFTGIVLKMDGKPDASGDIFQSDSVLIIPPRPIPVTLNFGSTPESIVGEAKVLKTDEGLKYELTILENRLTHVMAKTLKPCLGGAILSVAGKVITKAKVSSIGLALENADDRIKRLGEDET